MSLKRLAGAALACGLLLAGCNEPTGYQELEHTVDYRISADNEEAQRLRLQFLEDIKQADDSVDAALTGQVMDEAVAQALIDARERGVAVQLVADRDDRSLEGFQALENAGFETPENSDCEERSTGRDNSTGTENCELVYGDGELRYLPDPTLTPILESCVHQPNIQQVLCSNGSNSVVGSADDDDIFETGADEQVIVRPGSFNVMSHNFAVIDRNVVWNLASLGDANDSLMPALGWRTTSELIRQDFVREFKQLHGGTFATTLDVYNGPLKATTDPNVDYINDKGMMRIMFNPQERLLKHVIDEVYRARTSVQVITPKITNPFLLQALEYKQKHGFEVDVIVDRDAQPEGESFNTLRDTLGARAMSVDRQLPTVVITDATDDGAQRTTERTAIVSSHPLWHAQPFKVEVGNPNAVHAYPSDQFTDGNLWMLYEFAGQRRGMEEIDQMISFYDSLARRAQEL